MNASTKPSLNSAEASPPLPSETVRTVVSLLLFMQLFAIEAVLSFWATRPQLSSEFERETFAARLHNVAFLTAHMQYLFQDLGYSYFLTQADQLDVDHQLLFDLKRKDGTTSQVQLPQPGLWPGIRRQRMQMLANLAGQRVGEDGTESVLPRLAANYFANRDQASSGTVRLRAHLLIPPENVAGADTALADPFNAAYYRTPYEAQILVRGGQVSLLKNTAAGETAPSAGRSRGTSPTPPPANPQLNP